MRILAIETSCDETAIAVLSVSRGAKPKFRIEAHKVASQIELHKQYGGVFPMMAKREHSKNSVPLLLATLKEAGLFLPIKSQKRRTLGVVPDLIRDPFDSKVESKIQKILEREPELLTQFLEQIPKIKKPKIDRIAVTVGPGLAPALWVGINFARALALAWNIEIVPVNHMEGHVLSVFPQKNRKDFTISHLEFPLVSLLVSGGHTEIVLVKKFGKYQLVGQTRDDAAGEAFDKTARMMDLSYPGGPLISKLAAEARERNIERTFKLPRPMIASKDFDFSFSGLKTSVLYLLRDLAAAKIPLDDGKKMEIAREFEDAVCDVLISKTLTAAKKYGAKKVIVGGGVSANKELARRLIKEGKALGIEAVFPAKDLATDNAIMIGIAGYFAKKVPVNSKKLIAIGNLSL